MSYVAGALTIDGVININAPGPSSGVMIDGTEIAIPVPSDWNATDGEAQILNKPTALSNFTNDLTQVLGDFNIPGNLYVGGAAAASGTVQVPADWAETDATKADYIKNKPLKLSAFINDLAAVAGDFHIPGNLIVDGNSTVTPGTSAGQVNADWNATSGAAQILNKPQLAPVATGGSLPKKVPWTALTLLNGAMNVPNQQPCQYCIDELGYVRLRGYVMTPSSLSTTIFQLNSNACPGFTQYTGNDRLVISTSGTVQQQSGTAGANIFFNYTFEPSTTANTSTS